MGADSGAAYSGLMQSVLIFPGDGFIKYAAGTFLGEVKKCRRQRLFVAESRCRVGKACSEKNSFFINRKHMYHKN